MIRPKTLIHLLVSSALILNGVGAAAASAVMATTTTSAEESVVSKGESARADQGAAMQSGCHEHADSMKPPTTDSPTTKSPTTKSPQDTDCCDDGTCGCGCAHQSQVVLTAEFMVMPAIPPASTQWEELGAPLSPSLPKPVRPPIG